MKKILFINPNIQAWSKRKLRPVGLAYIMTAVKNAGIEFDFYDMYAYNLSLEDLKNHLRQENYDIFALGTIVTGFRLVRRITSVIRDKNPKAIIIAGNSVASSIAEVLLRNTDVDIAVIGEGDVTIVSLLHCLLNDKPFTKIRGIAFMEGDVFHQNQRQDLVSDLNEINFPDWSFFDPDRYNEGFLFSPQVDGHFRVYPLSTARGCPHHCTFCYHIFVDQPYRRCSDDVIIKEFKRLYHEYNATVIQFSDELTFPNVSSVQRLVSRIEALPFEINWGVITRCDLFTKKNIPLIRRMRNAGCSSVCCALESASQEILNAMGKNFTVNQAIEHISALKQGGVPVGTSVVFGYPQETPETIAQTFNLCERLNMVPGVGFLQPFPGTPIYDWAVQHGYIQDELQYLMNLGDREALHVNLTSIPTNEFINLIVSGISKLAKKFGLERYSQFLQMLEETNWQYRGDIK